jgi:hypothetical protein
MKSNIKILGAFTIGILIGVFVYDRVVSNSYSTYREVLRTNIVAEEELRASREERKGNNLAALFHRWNSVHFNYRENTRAFSEERKHEIDNRYFSPVALLILKEIGKASDPDSKGTKLVKAFQHGHLAFQMENAGFTELANQQWTIASKLSNLKKEELQSAINTLRKQFHEEETKNAEKVILGPDN